MNAPAAFESFIIFENEKKITIEKDTKVPNAAVFTICKEDHTLGNLLKQFILQWILLFNLFLFLNKNNNVSNFSNFFIYFIFFECWIKTIISFCFLFLIQRILLGEVTVFQRISRKKFFFMFIFSEKNLFLIRFGW